MLKLLARVAGDRARLEIRVLRHDASRKLESAMAWLAHRLPRVLRKAVLVDCAVRATTPPRIGPHDYAGPDGVDYRRMYEAL